MLENLMGYYSLGENVNKVNGRNEAENNEQGLYGDNIPFLNLDTPEDDLLDTFKKWKSRWDNSPVKANWLKKAEENEKYWKGEQFSTPEVAELRPLVDNFVFQSVETYLPIATQNSPEPEVDLAATEQKTEANLQYANLIRARLGDWADDVKLKLKLKKTGRSWLLNLLGVAKMGWDTENNRPAVKIIRPRKLILDPDAVVDEDGYNGKFIGEYRKLQASVMLEVVTDPKKQEIIKSLCKGDTGSDIQFIEWWTPEYMCWEVDEKDVLLAKKNPHWNYAENEDTPTSSPMTEDSAESMKGEISNIDLEPMADNPTMSADTGMDSQSTPGLDPEAAKNLPAVPSPYADKPISPVPNDIPAPTPAAKPRNHFASKKVPYVFISIFNLGKTPVDETSLVTQVLPQQDLINKRNKQIDKNVDSHNNGIVVSEARSGLTQDEAKGVTDALLRGGVVTIPDGDPNTAIARFDATPIPADVFNNLTAVENRFYDLFGIRGLTAGAIKNETTVRGKVIVKGLDTDRIGGGITEFFEQFADDIFNWCLQLMYVYDDILTANPQAQVPKLKISVKAGSLLPKDASTKANQAIELANGGKMALVDLYKALEYPNPEEMAANVWLEANAPELLYPDNKLVQQVVQQRAQAAQAGAKKPPSESINFKDLPPDGKAQLAAQAGINLDPNSIAEHETAKANANKPPQGAPPQGGEASGSGSNLLNQVNIPNG